MSSFSEGSDSSEAQAVAGSSTEHNVQWIPGHCMYKPGLVFQMPDCPLGQVWRKGHYRNMPSVQDTHKYVHRFTKKLTHRVARHPQLCPSFQDLIEFKDCMKMVKRSLQSYLLKQPPPSKAQVKQYVNNLVERVIYCTGTRLQHDCYFQADTKTRKYIETKARRYAEF